MSYTKIIATVGPASSSVDQIRGLIRAGASCCRVNFSHGDGPTLTPLMEAVREAAHLERVHVPILADIQGPKLRVGQLPDSGVLLSEGARLELVAGEDAASVGSAERIFCSYSELARDVEPATSILLADGLIELEVERVEGSSVHCRVVTGGRLYSRKGLTVPGRPLRIETLTEKDRKDLAFLSGTDVDMIAVSFVRRPADLLAARALLGDHSRVPVMAKLERPEALEHLDAILEASDGVMVARGDLGVELPFERVPVFQKEILMRAAERGKWVVIATQMLASMVSSRRPSRAEASDVLNAVLDGADAVMLSEETAAGDHPIAAVEAMRALTRAGEDFEQLSPRAPLAGTSRASPLAPPAPPWPPPSGCGRGRSSLSPDRARRRC